MARILFLLTSRREIGGTGRPTGFHWDELATPYWACKDAGHDVTLGSVLGGEVAGEPGSEATGPGGRISRDVRRFQESEVEMEALKGTLPVVAAKAEDFEAIFLPGGAGTFWDLEQTPEVGALIGAVHAAGGVIGTISTGAAGLLPAITPEGEPLVRGRRINAASDAELEATGLAAAAPYSLETALRGKGARYGKNEYVFRPHALRDGRLVTGQNPASAGPVARLFLRAIEDMGSVQPPLDLGPPALLRRPG